MAESDEPVEAADDGNLDALFKLGAALANEGDLDGAEPLLLRAAEAGHAKAMGSLGLLLYRKDEHQAAEAWWLRAAEAGNPKAMTRLGMLDRIRGDLEGAENWYRAAVNAGEISAMSFLGALLRDKGDLDGAETWLRRGAESGDRDGVRALGHLLHTKGDLDGALEWVCRSVESGDTEAFGYLGTLLREKGDLQGAEEWTRRGAEAGNPIAMYNFGLLLTHKGDLDGAEEWSRRAAEGGNTKAMAHLGVLLRDRGDLEGAATWLRQAADAGNAYAVENLDILGRKVGHSDRYLDSIAFETFGWRLSQNEEWTRRWRGEENATLGIRFVDTAPIFESWDEDEIREGYMEAQDLMESPTFAFADLELPENMQPFLSGAHIEQVSLLDFEVFEIERVKCLLFITRHRAHDEVHYASGIMVMFAECFWMLGIEVEDDHTLAGAREGAVVSKLLGEEATDRDPNGRFDPYDRRWDGIVPLEDDPLTRTRLLTARLKDSITLRGETAHLTPIAPSD